VIAALVVIVLALLALLAAACIKVERVQEEIRDRDFDEYHRSVEDIARHVRGAHDAALLHRMADRWESVEEQGNLRTLAREQYTPGGPSMPALWLRQQASLIQPEGTEGMAERSGA
jgi:cytochrome c556